MAPMAWRGNKKPRRNVQEVRDTGIYLENLQRHLLVCGITCEAVAHGLDNDINQQLIAPWRPAIARQVTVRDQFLRKRDAYITQQNGWAPPRNNALYCSQYNTLIGI